MSRFHIRDDAAWSFETARFFVGFYAEPEDLDPADSFQFPEDIEAVRSGAVDWFCACVRVYLKGEDDSWCSDWRELASDYLGGCAYNSVREFYTAHRDTDPMNRNCSIMRAARGENVVICHYFPSMVQEAVSAARAELARLKSVPVRSVA
jgi:hypothetical protein